MPKMPMPHRNSSTDSDSIRKRVGKACDRCRLKKSKCDGSSPCSRCKADNAICVFGERKKSHDKVYPKGYVEMLEQQQSQLVAGLQETYRRLVNAQAWPGLPLIEHDGNPLTHDILARLDLLEFKQDGSSEMEFFEEDCQKLQERLVSDGAPFVGRRGSFSSESDHGDHEHIRPQQPARNDSLRSNLHGSPALSHCQQEQPVFSESWNFQASPSPIKLTPPPKMKQAAQRASTRPSPLSHIPLSTECIAPTWHEPGPTALSADFMRLPFEHQTLQAQEDLAAMMDNYAQSMDDAETGTMAFNAQFSSHVPGLSMYNPQDWMNEPMDVDFSKFVQVSAT